MPDDEAHSYSHMTATYSPEDNKLRLSSLTRLDKETYTRVREAGFKWAPKQEIFVAPMWTPEREDLLIELCGEIGDEDTSLMERQEQRAERFEEYSDNRKADAEAAHRAVHAIADGIPFGQPILVGHHSEKHARRDAEKIENGMRKAVKMWETSTYWTQRAASAIRHAKYKELPAVRARRIKGLESDIRVYRAKFTPDPKQPAILQQRWNDPADAPKVPHVWCAPHGGRGGSWVPVSALPALEKYYSRWIRHCENRLEYERAMLANSGGTVADRTRPEVGGACQCWASPGYGKGWSYIRKVNKVSVTIEDRPTFGTRNYSLTMPFDKLRQVMSAAEVEVARADGRLIEAESKEGFFLADAPSPLETKAEGRADPQAEQFTAMRETLKAGIQVISVPQLFPTPPDVAARMVELAEIQPEHRILEPSAGTGNILRLLGNQTDKVAVEINPNLTPGLLRLGLSGLRVHEGDFLVCNGNLGKFDRVLMNPPFENGSDIKHIQHAITFLNPGGRLVAICANGPRQNEILQPLSTKWNELPEGTFAGTGVRTVLLTIDEPEGGDL